MTLFPHFHLPDLMMGNKHHKLSTEYCLLLKQRLFYTHQFFFKLKETATETYENLQLVYGMELYHPCISENG